MTNLISWRQRAGTLFDCEKTPVTARRGMAVTNHPLASADLESGLAEAAVL
ncbi:MULTISPECIES: hypothetical protein [Bradyrhizobium]|uniref:hypothetical protein n=1 Tax=Bradyrhizobium TaxID=374 RepID=UPI0004B09593|nr:hypothetical protein [Bradyrhizobium liaoningense]WLB86825.1 hypothetical protein QIH91_28810 [Bradyrhizobium japonicum USDA 135]GLR95271.1 hypothetical protein GCM10007858_29060 [Bradyrhizobium liaoningense]